MVLGLLFPILFTVFLWWFTTGLIITLYGRSRLLTQLYFVGATLALLLAFLGILGVRHLDDAGATYAALTFGVIIWGWQLVSYYLGFITGPQQGSPPRVEHGNIARRFWVALQYGAYHELLAAGTALLLAFFTLGHVNSWSLWVYMALWLMHTSAKLNVFFGVRNFRIDLLPTWMHYMETLLGKRQINAFFPVSIIGAVVVVLTLLYQALAVAPSEAAVIGSLFVATMIALGTLEHILLVVPLPAVLYGWGIRALPKPREPEQRTWPHTNKAQQQPVAERVKP